MVKSCDCSEPQEFEGEGRGHGKLCPDSSNTGFALNHFKWSYERDHSTEEDT